MNWQQVAQRRSLQLERFARLGLRGNPFRVLEPEELVASFVPYDGESGLELSRLLELNTALVEFSAGQGVGKTTLLRFLEHHWKGDRRSVEYHYLDAQRIEPLPEPVSEIVIIDEAQRMSRLERTRMLDWLNATGGHVVTGTHRFWRTRRVPLRRHRLPRLDLHRVGAFFRRRIAMAGAAGRFELADDAARLLLRRGVTLRRIERWLYEVFQRWPSKPAQHYVLQKQELGNL